MDFMSPEDYAMALQLQEQFDSGASVSGGPAPSASANNCNGISCESDFGDFGGVSDADLIAIDDSKSSKYTNSVKHGDPSSWSLVDPRWEDVDPLPDIRALFLEFNVKYFWSKLAGIEVRWSPRMTLCAGLCVYEGHGGLCSVRLSEPLLKLRPRKDLIETLLHEMIHAYLFVTDNNKDHDGHGPEFHKHMYRLNEKTGTNISVYHTFHDEVANYRQHWWKCDGSCQKKPPYYGMVKRAMNRPPSARDPWWADHQRTCGGSYTKVKEPDGYKDKKAKKAENQEKKAAADKAKGNQGNMDIRIFGSKGKSLESTNSSESDKRQDRPGTSGSGSSSFPRTDSAGSDASGSAKPGVGRNIHGFDNTKSDKTNNYRANIHGFVKLTNDGSDDEETSQGDVKPVLKSFPGHGNSLGAKTGAASGVIVRKIPGIGVITTERPMSQTTNAATDIGDNPTTSTSAGTPERVPKTSNIVINYDSEDSDFDVILDKLLKPPAKKLKKKDSKSPFQAPGGATRRKSSGFTSVSNNRRHSDPDRWKKADKLPHPSSHLVGGDNRGNSGTRLPVKRKASGNADLAADRNKRAFYLSSSDSDSDGDFDEGATLGSVIKNKTAKSRDDEPEKKNCNTNSDTEQAAGAFGEFTSSSGAENNPFEMSPPPSTSQSDRERMFSDASPPPVPLSASESNSDTLRPCPVCNRKVPQATINDHLDECLLNIN